ncbi:hypothetical protein [Sphingomonas lycopersici]|uniref:Lipoprotein n=1 Tax=Sphingomonas lycopersici TaxID=2951807 RepID=A0AA41Z7Q4_9SPHN|nr:hypothetical protein [Sphingomonas lycopersici]MCW6535530.1 hypothetical protein [Sphingomonas lycopersici]
MNRKHIAVLPLIGIASIAAAACTERYGHDGISAGYASGYYSGYAPYWGWYGNYYYPGTGVYVYDRHRRAHHWDDNQRHYWQNRIDARRTHPGGTSPARSHDLRPNWRDFGHGAHAGRPNAGHSPAARPHVGNPGRGHASGGQHGGAHRRDGHSGGGHANGGHNGHNPHH